MISLSAISYFVAIDSHLSLIETFLDEFHFEVKTDWEVSQTEASERRFQAQCFILPSHYETIRQNYSTKPTFRHHHDAIIKTNLQTMLGVK